MLKEISNIKMKDLHNRQCILVFYLQTDNHSVNTERDTSSLVKAVFTGNLKLLIKLKPIFELIDLFSAKMKFSKPLDSILMEFNNF